MIDPKLIIKLMKEKRIKKISDEMFEVDNHNLFFQVRNGRRLILCDCHNHSIFPNESFCFHKEAIIGFEVLNYFLGKLGDKINVIEGLKYDKDKEKCFDIALDELKNLRELRI